MVRNAAFRKHTSLSASSMPVLHSGGRSTHGCLSTSEHGGSHVPVVVSAPTNRFHPALSLTSTHRFSRTQFRTVHGAHTSNAVAVARTAASTRARHAPLTDN